MKKIILSLIIILSLVACSDKAQENSSGLNSSNMSSSDINSKIESLNEDNIEVDVDLTDLSSTMVYAEVFNMVMKPTEYDGLTVKMRGQLGIYVNDSVDYDILAIIIADATQCCAQGLEIVPLEEKMDDFTEDGKEITIIGEFETYEENDIIYYRIKDVCLA